MIARLLFFLMAVFFSLVVASVLTALILDAIW